MTAAQSSIVAPCGPSAAAALHCRRQATRSWRRGSSSVSRMLSYLQGSLASASMAGLAASLQLPMCEPGMRGTRGHAVPFLSE